MANKDGMKVRGHCSWVVKDKTGNVVETGKGENLIMTAGLGEIVKLCGQGLSGTKFTALALGTSAATNTNPAQTTLTAEITDTGLARAAATVSQETTTTLQLLYEWTASGAKTIQEIGIFNNATSGGTMLNRLIVGPITVADEFKITFTYQVTFS